MFSSHAVWNLRNKFTTQEFNFEVCKENKEYLALFPWWLLWSPTHLHPASPIYLFVQMGLYSCPKQLWICECKEDTDHGDSRNLLALTSFSWPNCQNCGPTLKLPIAQYHKSDTEHPERGSPSQHPGAALHKSEFREPAQMAGQWLSPRQGFTGHSGSTQSILSERTLRVPSARHRTSVW